MQESTQRKESLSSKSNHGLPFDTMNLSKNAAIVQHIIKLSGRCKETEERLSTLLMYISQPKSEQTSKRFAELAVDAGLFFAEKAENMPEKEAIIEYIHTLFFYKLSGSSFHIASAYHHLATKHERLYNQGEQGYSIEGALHLYKQALDSYLMHRATLQRLAIQHGSTFYTGPVNKVENYIEAIKSDIFELNQLLKIGNASTSQEDQILERSSSSYGHGRNV